jgi:hypothetical protein
VDAAPCGLQPPRTWPFYVNRDGVAPNFFPVDSLSWIKRPRKERFHLRTVKTTGDTATTPVEMGLYSFEGYQTTNVTGEVVN